MIVAALIGVWLLLLVLGLIASSTCRRPELLLHHDRV